MVDWLQQGHEVYSIRHILRKNNLKNSLRQNKYYKKALFFFLSLSLSLKLQHSYSFTFNLQSFYELKHKVHHFSKSLYGISHFDYVLFLLKFVFTLGEHQKNVNLFFFNWDSFHVRLNSHYKVWSYKKKKHRKIKASSKSL